jgi:outer membrane protein OmpA-like peptidoglycan-associated protein
VLQIIIRKKMAHASEKKLLISLTALLLMLSGCGGSKKTSSDREDRYESSQDMAMPVAHNESMVSVFDDGLDAFVLEDDVENPFVQEPVTVADNSRDLDISWEEPTHLKEEIRVVYFDYDSSKPLEDQQGALEDLTKKAQEIYRNDRTVCVKGHACRYHGTAAYNVALSHERATTIKEKLLDVGIPESHLKVFGVGNEEPAQSTLEGHAITLESEGPNRRVELYALAA